MMTAEDLWLERQMDFETLTQRARYYLDDVLRGFAPDKIGRAVEILIDIADFQDGNLDEEDNGDAEPTGDEDDAAWTEWHTRGRHKLTDGRSEPAVAHEDDEEFDPMEDDDPAEDVADAEGDDLTCNVPCDPVYSLEPDAAGERVKIGRTNLLTSFRTAGAVERSADTGRGLRTPVGDAVGPGAPV